MPEPVKKEEVASTIPKMVPETIVAPELSEKEKAARNEDIMLMCDMRRERDQKHPELDDMTYLQYYESNRKKDLSYLPPKQNKQDVRIASGLTREKDTTLLSTMLNMNFVPDITAFDNEDLIVNELGDNMSDLVKKSREIENWQKKRPILYRELISQGDVFAQELYIEDFREMPLEDIEWDPNSELISDFSYKSRLQKVFSGCSVRMIPGSKVYLGSVRIEYAEDQDAIAVLNVISRTKAYSRYATWARWKNIPTTVDGMEFAESEGQTYRSWNLVQTQQNQIAEVMLFQPKKNRFQIYLNGTPMLPSNYPMTAIAPSGEVPIGQGKLEPISGFAYSKSQPSKTKIDDEVLSEATKLMIEGMRQGRKPPMGSRSKKLYTSKILVAGQITPDLPEGSVYPLLANNGLNASDFSFYQLIKQNIEEKSVSTSYEGGPQEGDPTATQVQQEKEQQMLKLGAAIDGIVNFERRLTWNRLNNILVNWTKRYDPNLGRVQEGILGEYRKFTVDTTLEQGQKGVKMFRFQEDQFPDQSEQAKEEQFQSDKYGKDVRIVYMNPVLMRSIKYVWFINIRPTPQSNDLLSQILFIQNLRTAMELFGPESLNTEYVKQRYAILINEDYSKFFKKLDIMQLLQMGLDDPAAQNMTGKPNEKANGAAGGFKGANGGRKAPLRAAIR